MHTKSRRSWPVVLDFFVICLLTAVLIRPLFRIKYTALWYSIESTFIADGRFLRDHWPHPLWQPLWYCGTRFDYIYPPALRYGTAALAKLFPILPVRAYHIYTAFFYCLGIAGVFLLVRLATGSRGGAWLAATAALLTSPNFLFLEDMRRDSWHLTPLRLGVLVRYGEGPHMSALAVLPLALLCAYLALQRRRPALLALAAVFSALVVSNNFYGATALAVFFPILVWSVWVTHADHGVWLRAAGVAALAYGLTAFWLVPSYLRITLRNMQYVSAPGNAWSRWLALAAAVTFGFLSLRFARGKRALAYWVFICGSALFLSLIVLGQRLFNFRLIGEAGRLIPELDLALILLLVECVRRLWAADPNGPNFPFSPTHWTKAAAVLILVLAFAPSIDYLRHGREIFVREADYQQRVEYRISDWIAKNLAGARCFVTGSVRFWYDTWSDLAQMDGGSAQGLMNRLVAPAAFFVAVNPDAHQAMRWMQAMGVDAVVVSDKTSQEVYHDFVDPGKFTGILPVIFDDHRGNVIYRIPRRHAGLAHVIQTQRFRSFPAIVSVFDFEHLQAYTDAIEQATNAAPSATWNGTDGMTMRADLQPGQSVLVQETYDPSWHAFADGHPVPIHEDAVGFMWIEAPPGSHEIQLQFELPLENRVGRILALISVVITLVLLLLPLAQKSHVLVVSKAAR